MVDQTIKQVQIQYLIRQLHQHGAIHNSSSIAASIKNAIDKMLDDQTGKWILQSHQESRCELPLTVIHQEKIQQLIIDRTFVDEHDTRWIIDYKTANPIQDESVQEFLIREKQQYEKQMQNYAAAFNKMEKDAFILVYTSHFCLLGIVGRLLTKQ